MEEAAARLGLSEKLEKAGLDSTADLLTRSIPEIRKALSINENDANTLLDAAANQVYSWQSRHQTGWSVVMDPPLSTLSTGDPGIDKVLGGGIPLGSITEVTGESSSGKTQLCLQLCLAVQRPVEKGGLGGSAAYLHSEGKFPTKRLNQMVVPFCQEYDMDPATVKSSIHTMQLTDRETQYRVIGYHLNVLLSRHKKIRLVVIDSISATYRGEGLEDKNRFERMTEICELGLRLKKLAYEHHIAIVTVNQVADIPLTLTANLSNPNALPPELVEAWMDFNLVGGGGVQRIPLGLYWPSLIKKPILGASWSNAVNTRIRLARTPMMDNMPTRRALFVEFSPLVPRSGCEFIIHDGGVRSSGTDNT